MLGVISEWLFDAGALGWSIRILNASAVGQTLFVVLWATLPWYRYRVGRALMVKSLGLMVYLDWTFIVYHFGPFAHQVVIGTWLFALVAFGIWSQVGAIVLEMRDAHRERKKKETAHA